VFRAPPKSPLLLIFPDVMGVKDIDIARAMCLFEEFGGKVSTACVDLYGKDLTPAQRNDRANNIGNAFGVMNGLLADPVKFRGLLQEVFEGLREYTQATHVGALGFCFGGSCCVETVRHGIPLRGIASFHGTLDAKLSFFSRRRPRLPAPPPPSPPRALNTAHTGQ